MLLAADLPLSSLLCSDSSLNLSLCPVCSSVCLLSWWLPGQDLLLNVQLSPTYRPIEQFENAPTNSPRGALGRAGTLGPHLGPGRPGAITTSRLVQSGRGRILSGRRFSGGAGGREDSGGGDLYHPGRAEPQLPWPAQCRWDAGHEL